MPTVRGCNLPDDLLYDVENHTWFTEVGDGTVRIGMTTIATAMAGQLVAFTPKKVGRKVRPGKVLCHRGIRQVGRPRQVHRRRRSDRCQRGTDGQPEHGQHRPLWDSGLDGATATG